MLKTFKYRLYPSVTQEVALQRTLDLTRELYNAALQERRDAWRKSRVSITKGDQEKSLVQIKQARPEFASDIYSHVLQDVIARLDLASDIYSHVLQDVIARLDLAFQGFFRRVKQGEKAGYPRFKGKGWWDSFKFKECSSTLKDAQGHEVGWKWTSAGRVSPDGKRINLPRIGKVKVKMHRPLEGRPKTLTIKREGSEWYAVYSCDLGEPEFVEAIDGPASSVGIDVGTRRLATLSKGGPIENPRHLESSARKIRLHSRTLSRRQRNSKRRNKARQLLARAHRKVARQRLDTAHKEARKLVEKFQTLVHEDIKPGRMVHGPSGLSRSILDAGWGQLLGILCVKAASAGRRVVKVDPRYTSQRCSHCGMICKGSRRREEFECVACGHVDDADHNAALNIEELGMSPEGYHSRTSTLGRAVPSDGNGRSTDQAVV